MRYSMIHTTQFRGHVVKYYIGLYEAWKALWWNHDMILNICIL